MMAAKGLDGDELERQARHRVFTGNRPSTTLIYPRLTPYVLGQIIALYEHRVFCEGVILGIKEGIGDNLFSLRANRKKAIFYHPS